MEYRPLEVTLLSADGIKNVNMFKKMDVYAVAYIYGYPGTKKKKTAVHRNCGTSPRWNQKLQFTIDERALSNPGLILVILLKADKSFCPDRNIGHVAVPFPELFMNANRSSAGAERVIEYQVRTTSGKPKGALRFSYKFGDKLSYNHYTGIKKADEPVTAYPPPGYRQGNANAGVAMTYPPNPGMGYQKPPRGKYPGHPHHPHPPPPAQGYYGAYPPPSGYPQPGYGYAPPPGYVYQQPIQAPKKKKKNRLGTGLGLGAGLLGGMLIGDIVSN